MLDISRLKNKKTLIKLLDYEGSNEYLVSLKNRLIKEGTFVISPSTADYIEKNIDKEPLNINRIVNITSYFGEELKKQFYLTHTPEKILVETVLGETDKSYHVKGKVFKNQKYSPLFYIPKTQVYDNLMEVDIEVDVDFDKYQEMDKRGWRVFKHQEEGIKFLLRKNKCILADDMGLGKSLMSTIGSIESGVDKVLIVCPSNAKINWFREVNAYIDEKDISIVKGNKWTPNKYTIINYDILKNFHTIIDGRKVYNEGEIIRDIVNEKYGLIIMDECFTYDTLVKTDIGDIKIGDIVENRMDVKILSYNLKKDKLEYKKLNRWIGKNTSNSLLKIKLPNDIFIECTSNHKIYVKNKGYVKAEEVREGDELYYLLEKNINRDRWEHTQNKEMGIFGQKEDIGIKFVRVEGVEILERGSRHEPRFSGGKNIKVYDLEVDDNHNYFANGVLVSNCHMAKNPKASRSKIINQICETIPKRWLLTGTPIANRPMDYFNLLSICESPITSSWQYYAFRYCDGKKFKKKLKNGAVKDIWLTDGASNLEELHERTKNLILRRKKDDHLDLPPKIVAPYYVELDDMSEYNRVFDEYLEWAKSEGKRLGAGRHMVELIVLRKYLAIEKTKQTIELAEQAIENGQKVIIFTNFTHSFDALMNHFGKLAVGHNGVMNANRKQNSIDEFQNNDKVMVFVGNLLSAGTAITLTKAEVVIMNDLDYVPANHAQAEDRAHRIGSTSTTNVYYPIAIGTIDEMIYEMLQKKRKIIDTVIGDEHKTMDIGDDIVSKFTN